MEAAHTKARVTFTEDHLLFLSFQRSNL